MKIIMWLYKVKSGEDYELAIQNITPKNITILENITI